MSFNHKDDYAEVTYLKISEANNETIVKGVEYQLCEDIEGSCVTTIFGENTIIVKEDGIYFTILDHEPFKYHRGILSLEQETALYVDFAKDFFGKKDEFKIDGQYNIEDCLMTYSIDLYSDNTNVSKFIAALLKFKSEFEYTYSSIENRILRMIRSYTHTDNDTELDNILKW